MKKLTTTVIALLVCTSSWAQLKGNGKIVTKEFPIKNITSLIVNFYADIEVDMAASEGLTITIDENLLSKVNLTPEDGKLDLNQKEWIAPSQRVIIKIGAPELVRIEQSTHETSRVENINQPDFRAMALVGTIILEGKVDLLNASGEIGEINAKKLLAKNVNINLWSYGKIHLGSPEKISGIVKNDGRVMYEGNNTKVSVAQRGGKVLSSAQLSTKKEAKTRFINFKLKNNSLNRINCYVVGPKPNGKKFSYGFPMAPGQTRQKDWSIGSKVYRVTAVGIRKLLKVITEQDEGEVVMLYDK